MRWVMLCSVLSGMLLIGIAFSCGVLADVGIALQSNYRPALSGHCPYRASVPSCVPTKEDRTGYENMTQVGILQR